MHEQTMANTRKETEGLFRRKPAATSWTGESELSDCLSLWAESFYD